jgi:hypothetical protein
MTLNTKIKEAISLAIKEDDVNELLSVLPILETRFGVFRQYLDFFTVELCNRADKELANWITINSSMTDDDRENCDSYEFECHRDIDSCTVYVPSEEEVVRYERYKDLRSFICNVTDTLRYCSLVNYTVNPDPVLVSIAVETGECLNKYTCNIAMEFLLRCLKEGFFAEEAIESIMYILKGSSFNGFSHFDKLLDVTDRVKSVVTADVFKSSYYSYYSE